mgnify:FL=1
MSRIGACLDSYSKVMYIALVSHADVTSLGTVRFGAKCRVSHDNKIAYIR